MKMSLSQRISFFLFIAGISFLVSGFYLNANFYQNKIYPGITIDNIDVSGLTISEAISSLKSSQQAIEPHQLILVVDDIRVSSSSSELGAFKYYAEAVNTAYADTRDNSKIKTLSNLIRSFFTKNNISAKTWYQVDKLDKLVSNLNEKVFTKGENPSTSLKISGNEDSIVVFKGTSGRKIDLLGTVEMIRDKSGEDKINSEVNGKLLVNAVVASTSAVLSDQQLNTEVLRAQKIVGKLLKLKAENKRYEIDDKKLASFLQPLGEYREEVIDELILEWSKEVNREPQEGEFSYNKETLEVDSFKPHKDGLEVDELATKKMVTDWLSEQLGLENEEPEASDEDLTTMEIPLNKTSPEVTLESTNDLGIKERIGFGESYYHHSIINRVHNVGITAERISLKIVSPGEEFSFNKTLGEVSAKTGYRSAYVISGGRTVLGDGGGVCQVSSTLFRTVLDAGLKVNKRLQHSYRVSYYELNSQPGFDATVYSGDIDFRFINDTENHILVYSYVELENRYMNIEIYGTDDGRTTEVSDYKKWDFRGPPAPEYYPTTDLATGVTKQIDWSVSGIKTEFTHTIKDKWGNVTSKESYYSNYRPWSAKYMRGI